RQLGGERGGERCCLNERRDYLEGLRRNNRQVDGITRGLTAQYGKDLVCHVDCDSLLSFGSRGAKMRRHHDFRVTLQGEVGRWRFLLENIDRGAGDAAAFQGAVQGRLVDQAAPGNVQDPDPGLEQLHLVFAEEVAVPGRQGSVKGKEVTPGQELFFFDG